MKRTLFISLSLILTISIFGQSRDNGENSDLQSRFADRKVKGYYSIMHVSLMLGTNQVNERPPYYPPYLPSSYSYIAPYPVYYYPDTRNPLTVAPSFTVTNGLIFNKHWAAGAGVGFEIFSYNLFPLFVELRHTLWDHKMSPFIAIKGGYSFGNFRAKHHDNLYLSWAPYSVNDARLRNYGGFMLHPEVGVKVPLNENSDLLVTAAYRYQKTKSVARQDHENGQYNEWEHKEELSRLSFGIAIMFR